jgi:hypothetical protein
MMAMGIRQRIQGMGILLMVMGMAVPVLAQTAPDSPSVPTVSETPDTPSSGTTPQVIKRSAEGVLTLFRSITLTPGFNPDPFQLSGISGGSVAAVTLADRLRTSTGICWGYVSSEPDYELVLTQGFSYLNLRVLSPGDTMLLVQGPGGTWCSDDAQGMNPSIAGQWLAGTYKIWVGSPQANQYTPYDLQLSEVE